MEVAAGTHESISLRAVALSTGRIPLPRVIFHWEARGNHPLKVYDLGEKESDRMTLFVKPADVVKI